MFAFWWPIGVLVLANIFYHVTAKSIPGGLDAFAGMVVSYVVAVLVSTVMYFAVGQGGNIFNEIVEHSNWTVYILGLAIAGLEVGAIFMYKAGWNINTGNIVQSIVVSIALLFVGFLFYKEPITANKVIGIVLCLGGLYFVNK